MRYADYLGSTVRGDLGVSARTGRPVATDLAPRWRPTLTLAVAGTAVAIGFALAVGVAEVLMSDRRRSWPLRFGTLLLISVPGFALAFLLVGWLSLRLQLLPTQGTEGWRALVLPALVLGLPFGAGLGRVLSSRLRAAMDEPFVVMARACGYGRLRCVLGWALPNTGVTMLVVTGNVVAEVATSTLVVEQLFGWPGIGSYFVDSLTFRDTDAVQATIVVLAAAVIGIRASSLLLAQWLDPRAAGGSRDLG